eukprot:1795909-Pleurochrysis_carterae.AAC.1
MRQLLHNCNAARGDLLPFGLERRQHAGQACAPSRREERDGQDDSAHGRKARRPRRGRFLRFKREVR